MLTNDIVSFEQLDPAFQKHLWTQVKGSSNCLCMSKDSITITYLRNLILFFMGLWTAFFQMKIFDSFINYGPNMDCGCSFELPQWGGSNKHPQSMFWPKIKKIMYTPANPNFPHNCWVWVVAHFMNFLL